jgi:hypothetical protein
MLHLFFVKISYFSKPLGALPPREQIPSIASGGFSGKKKFISHINIIEKPDYFDERAESIRERSLVRDKNMSI